jgi:DNA-binding transcriptional MerR regulator
MTTDEGAMELRELAERAGVTPRTVRYYIAQGLLPPPSSRGPGATYGGEHLDRLRLIRRLQDEHLPLAEIRKQLEGLEDEEVSGLLREPAPQPPQASTAVDYVRSLLAAERPAAYRPLLGPFRTPPAKPERSQWERISLTPDLELHVRRPLSRKENRIVDLLLEYARKLVEEERTP